MSEKGNGLESNLMGEIDAIVQNKGKAKKVASDESYFVEIVVDKEKSSPEALCGEVSIIKDMHYLDGSVEPTTFRSHEFHLAEDQLTLENYDLDKPIHKDVMKQVDEAIRAIIAVASDNPVRFKINAQSAVYCKNKSDLLVICETGKNREVQKVVQKMLFEGEANSHIDTESWGNSRDSKDKSLRWAFLELERRLINYETVIVTGKFSEWYDLMPIAVLAQLYRSNMVIGRNPGKTLSIGKVLDINEVFEHFLSNPQSLYHLKDDPFSAIEYFKNIDQTINSMVIFPSILHKFFSEK